MLLGMMSLNSVDKVSKHYCPYSMRKQSSTPDMVRLGLELVRTTTECLNLQKIPLLVLDQTLHDITISETYGKDMSVLILGGLHIEMA